MSGLVPCVFRPPSRPRRVTTPRSTRISPSRWPVAFCSSSASRSWSVVIFFIRMRMSPRRSRLRARVSSSSLRRAGGVAPELLLVGVAGRAEAAEAERAQLGRVLGVVRAPDGAHGVELAQTVPARDVVGLDVGRSGAASLRSFLCHKSFALQPYHCRLVAACGSVEDPFPCGGKTASGDRHRHAQDPPQRPSSRERGQDGPVRRLGHARRVLGADQRAHGRAQGGRPLRRLAHGRVRGGGAGRAGLPAARDLERRGQARRRPGPVLGPAHAERSARWTTSSSIAAPPTATSWSSTPATSRRTSAGCRSRGRRSARSRTAATPTRSSPCRARARRRSCSR